MKKISKTMKVRYCPYCVQLVHFEVDQPVQCCWNCHRVSNFDLVKTPEQQLGLRLLGGVSRGVQWSVERLCPRPTAAVKFVLVAAVPAVVTMLLVSNSFDVRIVRNLTTSFRMVP